MRKLVLLAVAICLLVSCEKDDSLREVDDVCSTMNDPNFKSFCLEKFDADNDGTLSMEETKWVTRIICSDKSITSLKGIEYFPSLSYLDCSENHLTSLDMSKNTQLSYLDCWLNDLTSLNVSKNSQLANLLCNDNKLSSLNVKKNTLLIEINCGANNLTSLDLSKNKALTLLYCQNNSLTSLDISENTLLKVVHCYNNDLTSLDASKNTSLNWSHFKYNPQKNYRQITPTGWD